MYVAQIFKTYLRFHVDAIDAKNVGINWTKYVAKYFSHKIYKVLQAENFNIYYNFFFRNFKNMILRQL